MKLDLLLNITGFAIIFLLLQYFWKQRKDLCDATENRFYTDIDETVLDINYKMIPPTNIHYLFWTGGYDSTFRLCQILILLDRPVQPIYVMCGSTDMSRNIINPFSDGRQNIKKEIQTMKNIRKTLLNNFPHLKNKFLPTYYVKSIKKDIRISKAFANLHTKLGYFTRSVNQYERLARFSSDFPYPIEIGLENCNTGLDEATNKFRTGIGAECRIIDKLPIKHHDLYIFKNFRFPIAHLTKKEMRLVALKNNFYYLLSMTWSCWYPTKNGQPCGNCEMCRQRIIY